jgi:hypothetical protein
MLGLFLLIACKSESPLPTRVEPAATLALEAASSPTVEATSSSTKAVLTPVPPTYTIAPRQQATVSDAGGNRLKPTLTPSPTSTLPPKTPTSTSTPSPTATETRYKSAIPDLPPTDDLGPSKLGLHVVRNNDPEIMEFVRRAQPAVMKSVDDLGFLAEVKEASPRTITIGRISIESQDFSGIPEEEARRFVAQNLEKYQLNPAVDYWEGWNEPDPNIDKMIWYSRFEQERVREMARHGFKTAIGGFATGVPEMHEFELFLPAIQAAKEHGGILSLHEYGAPDMLFLYGDPLPGYPAYPDRGSLTFRYRWFYREYLEPGDMVIPLVITEAGIDGIIGNRPGPGGFGWQDFQSYWVQQGLGTDGPQAFINQLAWYDAGVREDWYVIGFTIFTAGGFGYWEKYDINPILPDLANYAISQR